MTKKIEKIIASKEFLFISCLVIFCLSIFLRSLSDIGPDTGTYIEIGKKIAQKKKYYYDFFESNFPLSFYYYSLQYQISLLTKINQVILSEIFINSLAVLSIFFATKILKNTAIYENKSHYNLIIIACFLGFFLRYPGIKIAEFGTKTSLLLILLYPYLAYSFCNKNPFTKKDLLCRGTLMGLIPCLKPQYLILIIFIEALHFSRSKNFRFFLELDKLVMALIGVLYLVLMINFMPEFFEFIHPMMSKYYAPYSSFDTFFKNGLFQLTKLLNYSFILLVFSRLKPSFDDKILAALFIAAILLIFIENAGTIDQISAFNGIATICFGKFLYDFFSSKEFSLKDNKLIISALFLLPIFNFNSPQTTLFGGIFIAAWWIILIIWPFVISKKQQKIIFTKISLIKSAFHVLLLCAILLAAKSYSKLLYSNLSFLAFFIIIFLYEKKNREKNFSHLTTFLIIASSSLLFYGYANSIVKNYQRVNKSIEPNPYSDFTTFYIKKFAPDSNDNFIVFSDLLAERFPLSIYLGKENDGKVFVNTTLATAIPKDKKLMFDIRDLDNAFTFSYLLSDAIKQIENPHTKVIFINNSDYLLNKGNKCVITALEYHFLSNEFRKIFLKNFHFENHIILTGKRASQISIHNGDFDQLLSNNPKVVYEFDVYVRR